MALAATVGGIAEDFGRPEHLATEFPILKIGGGADGPGCARRTEPLHNGTGVIVKLQLGRIS